MSITITITEKLQLAGAGAAAVAADAVSTQEYLQKVVENACLSYRDQFAVDRVTGTDFLFRFTAQEFADINASTDPIIQNFITEVKAAPYVWLGSDQVIAAMEYVVADGLLTQARADEILYYPIPEPVPPTPDP